MLLCRHEQAKCDLRTPADSVVKERTKYKATPPVRPGGPLIWQSHAVTAAAAAAAALADGLPFTSVVFPRRQWAHAPCLATVHTICEGWSGAERYDGKRRMGETHCGDRETRRIGSIAVFVMICLHYVWQYRCTYSRQICVLVLPCKHTRACALMNINEGGSLVYSQGRVNCDILTWRNVTDTWPMATQSGREISK